jgi:hypothetical protein
MFHVTFLCSLLVHIIVAELSMLIRSGMYLIFRSLNRIQKLMQMWHFTTIYTCYMIVAYSKIIRSVIY